MWTGLQKFSIVPADFMSEQASPADTMACVASLPCASDGRVMSKKMTGFPLNSVKTFWWTAYYYYGIMSEDNPNYDPQTIARLGRMHEMDLAGRGFVCEAPLDDMGIRVPKEIGHLPPLPHPVVY